MIDTETRPIIEIVQEDEPEIKEVVTNVQEIPSGISGGGTGREGTDGEKLEERPDLESITSQPGTDEDKG